MEYNCFPRENGGTSSNLRRTPCSRKILPVEFYLSTKSQPALFHESPLGSENAGPPWQTLTHKSQLSPKCTAPRWRPATLPISKAAECGSLIPGWIRLAGLVLEAACALARR